MWRPRVLVFWLIGMAAIALPLATTSFAAAPTRIFVATASLRGANEVPPVTDTRATGTAIYQLTADGNGLTYQLTAVNFTSTPTMAHIHAPAPPGVNAPIVVFLFPPPNAQSSCTSATSTLLQCQGVITAADFRASLAGKPLSALLDLMAAGQTYTNAHTTLHPTGEIRGQNRVLVNLTLPSPSI